MITPARRSFAPLLALVVLLSLLATPAAAQTTATRVAGGTPAMDAVGWSQLSFAPGSAPTVLIATDSDFADALTAGPVQGQLDAPLLLTDSQLLSPETAAELQRLGAEAAVIFGGTDAVSDAVVAEIEALGLTTERVAGATRLETAVAVVDRFFPTATAAALARAFGDSDPTQGFADSIGVGVYGAVAAVPVLLTETEQLSAPTRAALTGSAIDSVAIIGGVSAISAAVESEVDGIANAGSTETTQNIVVRRINGNSRFETAIRLNNDNGYTTAADSARVFLIEGQSDDAWTGGLPAAMQAGNDATLVLANGDLLLDPTFDFILDAGVPLICGPNVTAVACDKAEIALDGMGDGDDGSGEPDPTDPTDPEDPAVPGLPLDAFCEIFPIPGLC